MPSLDPWGAELQILNMPALTPSMTTGNIVEWKKQVRIKLWGNKPTHCCVLICVSHRFINTRSNRPSEWSRPMHACRVAAHCDNDACVYTLDASFSTLMMVLVSELQVGDSVAPGDAYCEIETDKATMSWDSQEEGT